MIDSLLTENGYSTLTANYATNNGSIYAGSNPYSENHNFETSRTYLPSNHGYYPDNSVDNLRAYVATDMEKTKYMNEYIRHQSDQLSGTTDSSNEGETPGHDVLYDYSANAVNYPLTTMPPAAAQQFNQVSNAYSGYGYGYGADRAKDMVYKVHFKRGIRNYALSPQLLYSNQVNVGIGSYVMVEADRGEDLGMVVAILSNETFRREQQRSSHLQQRYGAEEEMTDSRDIEKGRILRVASPYEEHQLPIKSKDETTVIQVIMFIKV